MIYDRLVKVMKRHLLRKRTMKYLYGHLLLKKPIFQLIVEEGHLMQPLGDSYIIDLLKNIETNEETYIHNINPFLREWSFERLSFVDQAILLLAIAEMNLQQDDKAVIIDEAIRLAKTYSDDEAFAYINAVLDGYDKKHS